MYSSKQSNAIADAYKRMLEEAAKKENQMKASTEVEAEDEEDTEVEAVAPVTDKDDDGEGMDPVGKEDDDVDNDGDTDDSDEYLKNRRKAVSKSMKKESYQERRAARLTEMKNKVKAMANGKVTEEQLEMLARRLGMSVVDLMDYLDETEFSMAGDFKESFDEEFVEVVCEMYDDEDEDDEEEEELEEISDRKKAEYIVKAMRDAKKKKGAAKDKRMDGISKASRTMGEEVEEELDEALETDGPKRQPLRMTIAKGKKADDYLTKKAQDRRDMNKKNDPGADKKGMALSVTDRKKAANKAIKKGIRFSPYDTISGKKPNRMQLIQKGLDPKMARESAEFDELLDDLMLEGWTDEEILDLTEEQLEEKYTEKQKAMKSGYKAGYKYGSSRAKADAPDTNKSAYNKAASKGAASMKRNNSNNKRPDAQSDNEPNGQRVARRAALKHKMGKKHGYQTGKSMNYEAVEMEDMNLIEYVIMEQGDPTGLKLYYKNKAGNQSHMIVFTPADAARAEKEIKKEGGKLVARALMFGKKEGEKHPVK